MTESRFTWGRRSGGQVRRSDRLDSGIQVFRMSKGLEVRTTGKQEVSIYKIEDIKHKI